MSKFINVHTIRLAAFTLAYGLTGALTGGTLNRIMVVELGLPISLVGLFFAAPLFISPLRTWIGYRSDGYPIRGLRREPYIIVGTGLASIGVVLAILLLMVAQPSLIILAIGVMVAFLIHEFGRNLAHNSFQSLLADKFTGIQRARVMVIFEVVTILGLIMGAGGIAGSLREYSPSRLISVTIGVAVISFVLSVIAVFRNEKRVENIEQVAQVARSQSFGKVMREMVVADKQVRLFFVMIMLVIIGTLAQDILLEPYAGLVLNMEVADTSRLTMYWGIGVIIAMLLSSLFLIKRFGQVTVLRAGLIMTVFVFAGVIITGAMGQATLFRIIVLVMGFGTGLAGAGLLTSIINFTTSVRSGLLLGVWGFAMISGRALGGLFGGIIVDITYNITNSHFSAYSIVFALEGILLAVALFLTARIHVTESSAYKEAQSTLGTDAALGASAMSS